jgi:hypothetical protein
MEHHLAKLITAERQRFGWFAEVYETTRHVLQIKTIDPMPSLFFRYLPAHAAKFEGNGRDSRQLRFPVALNVAANSTAELTLSQNTGPVSQSTAYPRGIARPEGVI